MSKKTNIDDLVLEGKPYAKASDTTAGAVARGKDTRAYSGSTQMSIGDGNTPSSVGTRNDYAEAKSPDGDAMSATNVHTRTAEIGSGNNDNPVDIGGNKAEIATPTTPKATPTPEATPVTPTEPGSVPGGLAAIPWKQVAIAAAAAGIIAGIIMLIRKATNSVKARFQKAARTLARMQKDFTLNKDGLDMTAVLPGQGSRINDKIKYFVYGRLRGFRKRDAKGAIGLYPFCQTYIDEVRYDFKVAQEAWNKLKAAQATAASDDQNEVKDPKNPTNHSDETKEGYMYDRVIYKSFADAQKHCPINESTGKPDTYVMVNESLTVTSLALLGISAGKLIIPMFKNGKPEKGKTMNVAVTTQSTREICYSILNTFLDKYVSMEAVSKKLGIDTKSLQDIDKSNVDKLKNMLEKYAKPDAGAVTKQYARLKDAYDKMLRHYLNIGRGMIKNFEEFSKNDKAKDEKHANLVVASVEKLSAVWDQQEDTYKPIFSNVVTEIVSSDAYINYLKFIIDDVIPVFKTGLASDADYVLDVVPQKDQFYILRQTRDNANGENLDSDGNAKAVARVVSFDRNTQKIKFDLIARIEKVTESTSEEGVWSIDKNGKINKDAFKGNGEGIELDYAKWLSLDPHLCDNAPEALEIEEPEEEKVVVSQMYARYKKDDGIVEYIYAANKLPEQSAINMPFDANKQVNEDDDSEEKQEERKPDKEWSGDEVKPQEQQGNADSKKQEEPEPTEGGYTDSTGKTIHTLGDENSEYRYIIVVHTEIEGNDLTPRNPSVRIIELNKDFTAGNFDSLRKDKEVSMITECPERQAEKIRALVAKSSADMKECNSLEEARALINMPFQKQQDDKNKIMGSQRYMKESDDHNYIHFMWATTKPTQEDLERVAKGKLITEDGGQKGNDPDAKIFTVIYMAISPKDKTASNDKRHLQVFDVKEAFSEREFQDMAKARGYSLCNESDSNFVDSLKDLPEDTQHKDEVEKLENVTEEKVDSKEELTQKEIERLTNRVEALSKDLSMFITQDMLNFARGLSNLFYLSQSESGKLEWHTYEQADNDTAKVSELENGSLTVEITNRQFEWKDSEEVEPKKQNIIIDVLCDENATSPNVNFVIELRAPGGFGKNIKNQTIETPLRTAEGKPLDNEGIKNLAKRLYDIIVIFEKNGVKYTIANENPIQLIPQPGNQNNGTSTADPSTNNPETQQPETQQPETQQPETQQPENKNNGSSTADTSTNSGGTKKQGKIALTPINTKNFGKGFSNANASANKGETQQPENKNNGSSNANASTNTGGDKKRRKIAPINTKNFGKGFSNANASANKGEINKQNSSIHISYSVDSDINEAYMTNKVSISRIIESKSDWDCVLTKTVWGDGTYFNPKSYLNESMRKLFSKARSRSSIMGYVKNDGGFRISDYSANESFEVSAPFNRFGMLTDGCPLYESTVLLRFGENGRITEICNAGIHKITKK